MKISHDGKEIDVNEIEAITSKEDWNEYQMANGDVLQIKAVLIKAMRSDSVLSPDGSPLYVVNTQCIAKVKGVF